MQYTDLPSTWSSTLEKLALHTGHAQPPTGAHTPWYTTLMRFGKRGFFLAFLTTHGDTHVALRLEMSHPVSDSAQTFAHDLGARLHVLGMEDVTIQHDPGTPAFIDMNSSERLDDKSESIEALLLLLMKTGDYIIALDQDPNATSPLQDTSQTIKAPLTAETPSSGFEVIGASNTAPQPSAPSASSPFETIGASEPAQPSSSADTSASDEVQITHHDIRMRQDHVLLEVEFTPAQAHPSLIAGLEHMLGTRFDALVAVTEAPSAGSGTLRLRLQPGLTTATQREVDTLGEDITRYIKKLKDFNAMGVPLKEILGVAEHTARVSSPRERPERTTRRDIPSRRDTQSPPSRNEEPPTESTGFVLGLGASQASSHQSEDRRDEDPEHTLTPGDFTDTRLRREDADGPLVDLVLRHPGYSDRNMSKVLTLLLSIEYSKAMGLIEKAPCVLSWGIGRERAQTMKSVIEGAGGKVVMVEPDTFAAS